MRDKYEKIVLMNLSSIYKCNLFAKIQSKCSIKENSPFVCSHR